MNPQLLPAKLRDDVPAWAQTVQAFLAEKERRSGSWRTVEDRSQRQPGSRSSRKVAKRPTWTRRKDSFSSDQQSG